MKQLLYLATQLVCSGASFGGSLPALRNCLANSQGPFPASSSKEEVGVMSLPLSCCKQGWQSPLCALDPMFHSGC